MTKLLLFFLVMLGSLWAFPGMGQAEVFKTDNIEFEVFGCQVFSYKENSQYGFDAVELFDEGKVKSFEAEAQIGFNIALLVNKIDKAVQVEWTLFWIRPDKNGEGIEYSGWIREEASPENFVSGLFLEDRLGNKKTVIPLFVRAKRRFSVHSGNHEVALFKFMVDGHEFNFKKNCRTSYMIE